MRLGILDWGIGGGGLYQEIKARGDYPVIYLSDAGYTPYGKVEKQELTTRVMSAVDLLRSKGATHVAIACHAAGTVIQESDSVTTVVTHATKLVRDCEAKRLGVIGGYRTIDSQLYELSQASCEIVPQVAQKLSAHVERGDINSPQVSRDVEEVLKKMGVCDAILLACTHYPALNERFTELSPHTQLLDPARSMATWIAQNWALDAADGVADVWYTTGDPAATTKSAKKAYNIDITNISRVEL